MKNFHVFLVCIFATLSVANGMNATELELESCKGDLAYYEGSVNNLRKSMEDFRQQHDFEMMLKEKQLNSLEKDLKEAMNAYNDTNNEINQLELVKVQNEDRLKNANGQIAAHELDMKTLTQQIIATSDKKDELAFSNKQLLKMIEDRKAESQLRDTTITGLRDDNSKQSQNIEARRNDLISRENDIVAQQSKLVDLNNLIASLLLLHENKTKTLAADQTLNSDLNQQLTLLSILCDSSQVQPNPDAVCQVQDYDKLQVCEFDVAAKKLHLDLQVTELNNLNSTIDKVRCEINAENLKFQECGHDQKHCVALLSEQQKIIENRQNKIDADMQAAINLQKEMIEAGNKPDLRQRVEHMIEALLKFENTTLYKFEPDIIPRLHSISFLQLLSQVTECLCKNADETCPPNHYCGLKPIAAVFAEQKSDFKLFVDEKATESAAVRIFVKNAEEAIKKVEERGVLKSEDELNFELLTSGKREISVKDLFGPENFDFEDSHDLLWMVETTEGYGWFALGPPEVKFLHDISNLLKLDEEKMKKEVKKYTTCKCPRGVIQEKCVLMDVQ